MDVHRERLVKCYFQRHFVAFVHFASSSSSRYVWAVKKCAIDTSFNGYRFSRGGKGKPAVRPLAVSVDLSSFPFLCGEDALRVDFHPTVVYKPEM